MIALAGISLSSVPVWAGPPRGPGHGFFPGPGPLFELIVVGTRHLFFRDGAFYRRGPAGYVVVDAPEGAIIQALPHGFGIRIVDNAKYYYYQGIYYVRVPDGYMVVAPPVVTASREAVRTEVVELKGEASVTADMLNVRSGPGMKYGVTALAYKGEVLKIYNESDGWLYVEIPSGRSGWVDSKFTSSQSPVPAG